MLLRFWLCAAISLMFVWGGIAPASARAQGPRAPVVYVFPTPGSRVAPPEAQIVFRGLPAGRIGRVSVVGSRSGHHRGRVLGDSDGDGGSFIPSRGFTPGETVTVGTRLNVAGGRQGAFRFTVAEPAAIPASDDGAQAGPSDWPAPPAAADAGAGDVLQYRTLPGLAPEAVRVVRRTAAATPWDIFVAPQAKPGQIGTMILGPDGSLIWFRAAPRGDWVFNFQVQSYHGAPVLTWWQGHTRRAGFGIGEGLIYDSSYRQVAVVHAADGLNQDMHEFQITPQGSALITAYYPVYWKHGKSRTVVWEGVVQEIDIPTGLLLFQWDSLDHVSLSDSYDAPPDYFHINSIQQTGVGGALLISSRNTWAGYLVDHHTGRVVWRLGGKRSSFKLGPGAAFAFQHDIRLHPLGLVTLYDDGAGVDAAHTHSRGLMLALDARHMTARLVLADRHSPALLSHFEGNDELLSNGHSFVAWGGPPYFTEFDARGHIVFDARFVGAWAQYRAFLEPWSGTPVAAPGVAAAVNGTTTTVYASWNGSTTTAYWQVLAGSSPQSLQAVTVVPRAGFETSIPLPATYPYVAVRALDSAQHLLGTSAVIQPH